MNSISSHKLLIFAFLSLLSISNTSCLRVGGAFSKTNSTATATVTLSYSSSGSGYYLPVGITISTIVPSISGKYTSLSITPPLPTGLSLNAKSGSISGTPTSVTALTVYTVKALDSDGKVLSTATIDISTPNFGSGSEGILTVPGIGQVVNTYTYMTNASVSSGASSFDVNSTVGISANDEILIIQMQNGASSLAYEFASVLSISSPTLTLKSALTNSYTSGTYNAANAKVTQVVRVPQYTNLTVPVGTSIVSTAWNGNTGGIVVFRVQGTLDVTGSIQTNGLGFRGGSGNSPAGNITSTQGESISGTGIQSILANAGGGAGSNAVACTGANGAGAGHRSAGGVPSGSGWGTFIDGAGGNSIGNIQLNPPLLGSGGGGSVHDCGCGHSDGAAGGGMVLIFANQINVTGSIQANGASSTIQGCGPTSGGGGAGGSIYLYGKTLSLGTSLVTASGGTSPATPTGGPLGSAGSEGRIRIDSPNLTGTTSPTHDYNAGI